MNTPTSGVDFCTGTIRRIVLRAAFFPSLGGNTKHQRFREKCSCIL